MPPALLLYDPFTTCTLVQKWSTNKIIIFLVLQILLRCWVFGLNIRHFRKWVVPLPPPSQNESPLLPAKDDRKPLHAFWWNGRWASIESIAGCDLNGGAFVSSLWDTKRMCENEFGVCCPFSTCSTFALYRKLMQPAKSAYSRGTCITRMSFIF